MKQKITYFIVLLFLTNALNAQIVITEIFYNTPYNERLNIPNQSTQQMEEARKHHWGEFIEIYNFSDRDLSLQNWYIQDRLATVWLPAEKIIKSGDFMVIAYSTLRANSTPFTELFSRTKGKESQIYYQNQILLRNKRETVTLGYNAINNMVPLSKGLFEWSEQTTLSNYVPYAWQIPDVCYTRDSYNLTANGTYVLAPSNPLEAAYKPPIQKYEDIMKDVYQENYSYIDWGEFVREIVNKICGISISLEQQPVSGTYTGAGKCFQYDIAGNRDIATDCTSPTTSNPPATEYTSDELDEIKNYRESLQR